MVNILAHVRIYLMFSFNCISHASPQLFSNLVPSPPECLCFCALSESVPILTSDVYLGFRQFFGYLALLGDAYSSSLQKVIFTHFSFSLWFVCNIFMSYFIRHAISLGKNLYLQLLSLIKFKLYFPVIILHLIYFKLWTLN